MNAVLLDDLEYISNKFSNYNEFKNKKILVAGATGLIGSLLIKTLVHLNDKYSLSMRIIAAVRSENKASNVFKFEKESNCLEIITINLLDKIYLDNDIDFIVHTASITSSKEMVSNPSSVLLTAFESTKNILDYAKNHLKCSVIYISSMEYYGQIESGNDNVTEDKLGYIDLSKPRSCYPESKRVCEALCTAYAQQYGVKVITARLAQTFGAGVSFDDNRVFAQFARSAMHHKDIILHTKGLSEGNYCYTADSILAILILLVKGKSGEAYNISANHSSILNMAKLVANISIPPVAVTMNLPKESEQYGYAPDVKMKLNSQKLLALGWTPTISLEESFKKLINYWKLEE